MSEIIVPTIRPMLAANAPKKLNFPLLASPKIDGIRALIFQPDGENQAFSRSMKAIPNKHIQKVFATCGFPLEGLDGELTSGSTFSESSSAVMSATGAPDFTFWIFDAWNRPGEYLDAHEALVGWHEQNSALLPAEFRLVPQTLIETNEQLDAYENRVLVEGNEGVILRSMGSPYKQGRSTQKEGYLLKLKRFLDAEAEIVGYEELYRNENEPTINELGYTSRSQDAENLYPAGVLGSLICRTPEGVTFGIGTGFDDFQRKTFWEWRGQLIGQIAKYKHFPQGAKDAPRHPVFLGIRSADDTSE